MRKLHISLDGREIEAHPMVRMGGMFTAWYHAEGDEEEVDGWLVLTADLDGLEGDQ